jgi:glycosyltransferase involved in cell wall biosynthesis
MKRSVLFLQYTSPANYPPLEHSGAILLRAGWNVHYFGIQSEGESNKLKFPEPLACRQTLWTWTPPGWRQKLQFLQFTSAAVWRAMYNRPDWVYCSDIMSCPAGWLIQRLTRCRVLYHEHDSPRDVQRAASVARGAAAKVQRTETEEAGAVVSRFQRFLLRVRRKLGREADLVVLPNRRRLQFFQETTRRQKPSICVFNCPRLDEVLPEKAPRLACSKLRLAFHGSINPERLPVALLPALAKFPGAIELQIVGYTTVGSSMYLSDFLGEAKRLRIDDQVNFVGALPRKEVLARAASCDVGLAFMPLRGSDINMHNMTGASNKPFDYLACGLALLVSARPDWKAMFVQPGYARDCDPFDADSIAAQLHCFLLHQDVIREMGERGRQRILKEWNYESQFAQVLELLTPA